MLRILTASTPAYAAALRKQLKAVREDIADFKARRTATALTQARAQENALVTELHRVLADLKPDVEEEVTDDQLVEALLANLLNLPEALAEQLHDALSDRLNIPRQPRGPLG